MFHVLNLAFHPTSSVVYFASTLDEAGQLSDTKKKRVTTGQDT